MTYFPLTQHLYRSELTVNLVFNVLVLLMINYNRPWVDSTCYCFVKVILCAWFRSGLCNDYLDNWRFTVLLLSVFFNGLTLCWAVIKVVLSRLLTYIDSHTLVHVSLHLASRNYTAKRNIQINDNDNIWHSLNSVSLAIKTCDFEEWEYFWNCYWG